MLNVYGPDGQRLSSGEEAGTVVYGPGTGCPHPQDQVKVVEDHSGIEGVEATQCQACKTGWLTKVKMQGENT